MDGVGDLALDGLRRAAWLTSPIFTAVDRLHDGIIGDYVAWIVFGLALFSVSVLVIGG